MDSLRDALRHHYIGAIMIGMLGFQGLYRVFDVVTAPVYIFFTNVANKDVYAGSRPSLNWNELLANLVRGALFLLLSYVLMRWLYSRELRTFPESVVEEAE